MIDEPDKRTDLPRWIIRTFVLVAFMAIMLVMLVTVTASIYLQLRYPEIPLPPVLKEWGSLCLGFMLGGLFQLVKEFVT